MMLLSHAVHDLQGDNMVAEGLVDNGKAGVKVDQALGGDVGRMWGRAMLDALDDHIPANALSSDQCI